MTKKLTIPVVLAFLVAISLHSCRSEDLLNSSEEQQPSKFRVFTAQEKETINYAKGFKTLLERYDEINNVQHTAKALKKALKNSSEMADEYVELNIRSQDFTTTTNEKFTLFPLIKNGKVDGIIIAILKENDTQVEFLKMYPEVENYDKMLGLFKEAFLKNTLQQRIAAKGNGNCSSDGSPCDTGEVVITMPGTGGGIPGGIWNGGPPPGGCQPYDNCLNPEGPGGTGGGEGNGPETPNPNTPANPCEQTKKIITNTTSKPAIDALKEKSTKGGEDGYKFKANGTPSDVIHGGAHSINFGNKAGYAGAYHNHTPTGIPMLSPPDIEQLLQFALAQGDHGTPSNAYMGMVAPNGMHYVATFNGNYNDALVSFSQQQLDVFVKDYETRNSLYNSSSGNEGLEKLFFKTLEDMGLTGKVSLQRVESDGTLKTIIDNNNGTTSAVPCL